VALTAEEIYRLVEELAEILPGARLDNIFSPSEEELILRFEGGDEKLRRHLLISAERGAARIHLLSRPFEAPRKQTNFCQLLRKHIRDARLKAINVNPGERIIDLAFDRGGERPAMTLIAELFGAGANIILVDTENKVRGAVRERREKKRDLHPHRPYVRPTTPAMSAKPGTIPVPGEGGTFNRAVEAYFDEVIESESHRRRAQELLSLVSRDRKRAKGRLSKLEKSRAEAADFENVRIKGELLKMNLKTIKPGSDSVTLENVFEDGSPEIEIKLDPTKSPVDNLEKYFKKYKKLRTGLDKIDELLPDAENRSMALEELYDELNEIISGETPADSDVLDEASERISALGIAPRRKFKGRRQVNQGPRRYRSSDGFELLVGRSNRENDQLTIRMARGNDIFLHAAGFAGSHVIVRVPRGKTAPLATLLEAAHLAAHFSKARDAGRMDIHYTPRKHVSKPKGARPGLVHLSHWKTLSVKKADSARGKILGSRILPEEVENEK